MQEIPTEKKSSTDSPSMTQTETDTPQDPQDNNAVESAPPKPRILTTRLKNIPFAKYATCGPLPDGRIMIMGGMTTEKNLLRTTNRCWIYNPSRDHFTPVQSMHEPRAYHTFIRRRNSFFVMGGIDNHRGNVMSSVEEYTILNSEWTK
jgi:hypothetical protein